MSQLVLIEVGRIDRPLNFDTLTGESMTCLASYADREKGPLVIRQYEYHPEWAATLYEFIVDWGDTRSLGPRPAGLGEILDRSAVDLAITEMRKQYEAVTETTCFQVRHEGRVTRCSFKPKGEYREPPVNLGWLDVPPPAVDLI